MAAQKKTGAVVMHTARQDLLTSELQDASLLQAVLLWLSRKPPNEKGL
jgi:hypothetical protein